ncbi:MAG: DUF222 domain-containing protein [Streptosporangiales bacterium]|nr:DUF222 domain-containing protein [Streptosporangiales bacterium]
MTEDRDHELVAGERRADLVRAFLRLRFSDADGGMTYVSATMSADVAAPLWRALMRVEAELLQHDAALVTADCLQPRTPDQRRADAFAALAGRALDDRLSPDGGLR